MKQIQLDYEKTNQCIEKLKNIRNDFIEIERPTCSGIGTMVNEIEDIADMYLEIEKGIQRIVEDSITYFENVINEFIEIDKVH